VADYIIEKRSTDDGDK